MVCLVCFFYVPVNSCGHVETVSPPTQTLYLGEVADFKSTLFFFFLSLFLGEDVTQLKYC